MTLEDIIEEIIQQEIVDETDVIADNRTKRKLKREGRKGKENIMLNQPEERVRRVNVSPQLTLAVFQYLTTSIEPFKSPPMSDSVLKKLLSLDVFREVKLKKDKTKMNEEDLVIIQKGTAIDYFILIIEGRVEVNIGREELVFESGPFTYFGIQVLNNVMENPASSSGLGAPTNKPVAALVSSQSQGEAITGGGGVGGGNKLRKASTQTALEVQLMKRNGSGSGSGEPMITRQGSGYLHHGGGHGHGVIPAFVPDYTVKAVSDVLYLRIKKGTYAAAIKASAIHKRALGNNSSHDNMPDIGSYLQKVNEHDGDIDMLPVMMRSPSLRSPDKDGGGSGGGGAVAAVAAMAAAAAAGIGSGSRGGSPLSGSAAGSPRAANRMDSFKRIAPVGGGSAGGGEDSKSKKKKEPEFWGDDGEEGGKKDPTPVVVSDLATRMPRGGGSGGGGGGNNSSSENGPPSLGNSVKVVAEASAPRTSAGGSGGSGGAGRVVAPLQLDESGELPSAAVSGGAAAAGGGGGDDAVNS